MSEWISTDTAVPPDERYVLVCDYYTWKGVDGTQKISRNIDIAQRMVFKNGSIKWRAFHGGYIQTPDNETKVTHWKPLPALPEG